MLLIDFHSHHPSLRGERVVQDGVDTRGRHPWHLDNVPPPGQGLAAPAEEAADGLLAIGESGLDRLCATPYERQLQVFGEEVVLSERLGLPLVLHCVRAIDDVLRIRRQLKARQPIVWHGFRGSARQLAQLLPHGFYFSFGLRHNEEALRQCPPDRLLLETDEDTLHPIAELYARAARVRGTGVDELAGQMQQNFRSLFGCQPFTEKIM